MRLLAFTSIICCFISLETGYSEPTNPATTRSVAFSAYRLETDLGTLALLRDKQDIEGFERLAESYELSYREGPPSLYADLITRICSMCNGSFGNHFRAAQNFSDRLAFAALGNGRDLSIEQRFSISINLRPIVVGPSYLQFGESKERIIQLLSIWRELKSRIDPHFDPRDVPVAHVVPPIGLKGPAFAGMDPSMIKDPNKRKEYKDAIAANNAKAIYYGEQTDLRNIIETYERFVITTSSEFISRNNITKDDAAKMLDQIPTDPDTEKEILKSLSLNN